MMSSIWKFAVSALSVIVAATAFAGGAVKVTTTYEGQPPNFKPIDMGQDKICVDHYKGGTVPVNEALVLGEGQTMANVLLEVVSGLPEGATYPVPAEPVVLTQEGCRYSPRMLVVRAGQTLKIHNPDGTLHNVNAQPRVNTPFNRSMPGNVQEIEVLFEKPEPLFPITCNVHPWMRAGCAVISHPYFAVTDKTGAGTVADLPPGEYEIRASHEVLGEKTAKVTVVEGQTAELAFTFTRPTKK